MGPCDLDGLLAKVPIHDHPNLLMGLADSGDVGIYCVSDEIAIVQSVDFFPPMVTDARLFGLITAANALSDIYACGARPVTALNLLAAPKGTEQDILVEILTGGHEKIAEAGAVVIGGHTIQDSAIKYGLSVTGVVHPDKIIRHDTPVAGDVLLLTKAIGTGILISADSQGVVDADTMSLCFKQMITLNKTAGESMSQFGTHAATDITGFGLIGHAAQMLRHSNAGFEIEFSKLPLLPGVEVFAEAGYYPGGSKRNMEYFSDKVDYGECSIGQMIVLNDAQTSGGLLISLPAEDAEKLAALVDGATIIGRVVDKYPGRIKVMI